jgi:signal recognition particle subunit SRP54
MFENLQGRLSTVMKNLRGQGRLTEKNIQDALREVRLALLEADVNFKVVKKFILEVEKRAVGKEVLESLSPGQQVIQVVHEELIKLIGGEGQGLPLPHGKKIVLMLVGLQGSGKTTTAAKLALTLREKMKRSPLLVACDVYRPAAIQQLHTVGEQVNVPVFSMGEAKPENIAKAAVKKADQEGLDTVILDTAGRLHIDENMMDELVRLKQTVKPDHILLIADSMIGQDATTQARDFHEKVGLSGVILTKLDGDTRGGAALSIREVTGRPIYYAGVGEKLDALETFHPKKMADRILGMGDVLTLVEKAQSAFDADQARQMQEKMKKESFDFEDFLSQLQGMKKMGSMSDLMKMIPGMSNNKMLANVDFDDKELVRIEAMINSMTQEERHKPKMINNSRRKRIARGSGTQIADVNALIKQFSQMQKMMKLMAGGGPKGKKGGMVDPMQLMMGKGKKKKKIKYRGKKGRFF